LKSGLASNNIKPKELKQIYFDKKVPGKVVREFEEVHPAPE